MSTELEVSEDQRRAEWRERRRQGIGGSDAPVVLGLSPWKSRLALWAEKTGLAAEESLDEKEYVEWGQTLEEPIARKYTRVTGRAVVDPGRFHIRRHPDRSWQICTIDREIIPIDARGPGNLSIKNTNTFKAREWEEEAPLMYQVQLQHELIVTGMTWGSFAVLIGGNQFRWCDAERNERFASYLAEKEEEFWDRVLRGDRPEPDGSDSTKEVLLRLFPRDTGESVGLPPEADEWDRELREVKGGIKEFEAKKQELENKLKAQIGNATVGLLPSGGAYSWKTSPRAGYTVQPTTVRTLRRVK